MNKITQRTNTKLLTEQIHRLITKLDTLQPDTTEYKDILDKIDKLTKIRGERKHITGDGILNAITNVLDIILITQHERGHVLYTKAMNFIRRV
jgi:hypothetical protein